MSTGQQPQAGRFGLFVKKHDHLLTFVGALVVGAGFFVNQYFIENNKDSLTKLKSAQFECMIAANFARVLSNDTPDLLQPPDAQPVDPTKPEDIDKRIGTIHDRLISSDNSLARTREVVLALPNDKSALLAMGKKHDEDLSKLQDDFDAALPAPAFQKGDDRMKNLDDSTFKLYGIIAAFEAQVATEGASQVHSREERGKHLTFLSYFLFLIGWTLGLIGKLFKATTFDLATD